MGFNPTKQYWIGQELHLTCETNGKPSPVVRWSRNGILIMRDNAIPAHGRSVLNWTLQSATDFGIYTCEAENTQGKDSWNFTVNQKGR